MMEIFFRGDCETDHLFLCVMPVSLVSKATFNIFLMENMYITCKTNVKNVYCYTVAIKPSYSSLMQRVQGYTVSPPSKLLYTFGCWVINARKEYIKPRVLNIIFKNAKV